MLPYVEASRQERPAAAAPHRFARSYITTLIGVVSNRQATAPDRLDLQVTPPEPLKATMSELPTALPPSLVAPRADAAAAGQGSPS